MCTVTQHIMLELEKNKRNLASYSKWLLQSQKEVGGGKMKEREASPMINRLYIESHN